MREMFSVLRLNFRQAARDRFFLGAAFFFFFYLAFCLLLEKLSPGESEKVLRSAGLAGIELTAVALSVFSFAFSFHREKETRILEVYLTDFPRSAYLAGKLSGYLLAGLLYIVFCAAGYAAILIARGAFHPACILALYPVFLKTALVIGWTSVFSCLFSSWMVSILCSFSLYIAAECLPAALKIISVSGGVFEKFLISLPRAFLPAFDRLDIKAVSVYGQSPPAGFFPLITLYAVIYGLFLWAINLLIFQKKEY